MMSGRKQHFIPQSLLNGFGFEKRKSTYVVAYTYDHGIFSPATAGIAAERHFYSELDVEGGTETLDDLITNYEQPFPKILATLRAIHDGELADNKMAAEFVTHLAIRNDHFRKSVAAGGANLLGGVLAAFADKSNAQAILGVNGDEPSGRMAGILAENWSQFGPLLEAIGMSEAQFNVSAFQMVKDIFPAFHLEMVEPMSGAMNVLIENLPELAANSQRNSMAESLAPSLRVEKMRELDWRVRRPSEALILPDCIAIAYDAAGECYPLMLADLESVETVLMPLSSDCLLVGSREAKAAPPNDLNDAFARCSWDFFVARDRSEVLEKLRNLLRMRVKEFFDDTVSAVLSEAPMLDSTSDTSGQ